MKITPYKYNKTCSMCFLNFKYDKKTGSDMCKECIKKLKDQRLTVYKEMRLKK